MRQQSLRRRSDGIPEVARRGRLRQALVTVALTIICFPAAVMVLLAMIAVLPVVVLVLPTGVVLCMSGLIWFAHEHRQQAGSRSSARIIALHR